MVIKDTGLNGKEAFLSDLDHCMGELGFDRGAWDYHHATYDYKFIDKATTYYLRIQAKAIEGRVEDSHAMMQLEEPFMGKHLFPHGIDYDAAIPDSVLKTATKKLEMLKEKLASLHH